MKLGGVLVIVAVVVTADATMSMRNVMWLTECKSKNPAPASDLKLVSENRLPKTREGKCLLACLLMKLKLMKANGQLDEAAARKWVTETYKKDARKLDVGYAVVKECASKTPKTGSNECDAAAEIVRCARTAASQRSG